MAESNSAQMTLADRLVQEMKGDRLGQLVTDDDLIDLAKKAIERSLTETFTVREGSGYSSTERRTTIVQEAAREIAQTQIKAIVEAFMVNETIIAGVQKYMSEILPGLVTEYMYRSLRDMVRQSYQKSTADLSYLAMQARITGISFGDMRHPHSDDDSNAIKVPHSEGGNGGI